MSGAGLQRARSQAERKRWYILGLSGALVLQGVLGTVFKIYQNRTDDLVHNGVRVLSGLLGLWLTANRRARSFAIGFGGSYLTLGLVGWTWANPFGVLPLGPGDNYFHLFVGGLTLAVALKGGGVKHA